MRREGEGGGVEGRYGGRESEREGREDRIEGKKWRQADRQPWAKEEVEEEVM